MLNGKIRNDFVGAGFDADAHGVQIDLCVASLEEPSYLVMELPQQTHGNRRRIDGFSVNERRPTRVRVAAEPCLFLSALHHRDSKVSISRATVGLLPALFRFQSNVDGEVQLVERRSIGYR